jgi:hypothetical protein
MDDDPILRGIANVDSTLVEEELADVLDELQLSTAIGITAVSVAAHNMENDVTCLWMELEPLLVKQIATFSVIALGRSQSGFHLGEALQVVESIRVNDVRTVNETTQVGRYSGDTSISREFPTNDRAL